MPGSQTFLDWSPSGTGLLSGQRESLELFPAEARSWRVTLGRPLTVTLPRAELSATLPETRPLRVRSKEILGARSSALSSPRDQERAASGTQQGTGTNSLPRLGQPMGCSRAHREP